MVCMVTFSFLSWGLLLEVEELKCSAAVVDDRIIFNGLLKTTRHFRGLQGSWSVCCWLGVCDICPVSESRRWLLTSRSLKCTRSRTWLCTVHWMIRRVSVGLPSDVLEECSILCGCLLVWIPVCILYVRDLPLLRYLLGDGRWSDIHVWCSGLVYECCWGVAVCME